MYLRNFRLRRFRNHTDSSFEFSRGTNVLVGENGHGKTNVIEAVSYLCLTKSYFAKSDLNVLNFESETFEIEGKLISDRAAEFDVRILFDRNREEKVFSINKSRIEPFSSVIGKFPVVICSPEHTPITTAGPTERRKFIDFVISQSNSNYFHHLIEYRKVLKHRNRIVFNNKKSGYNNTAEMEPWNEQLAQHGSYLMVKRREFVDEFQSFIKNAYQKLVSENEEPSIEYQPTIKINGNAEEENIRGLFRSELKESERQETEIGTTLIGPHRDEFLLSLNGLDLRKFASQGQHKSYLIALKIGEFWYLKDRCQEAPILLLDDIFSELDESRSGKLLSFIGTLSQNFITSTYPQLFVNNAPKDEERKMFYIKNGFLLEQRVIAA